MLMDAAPAADRDGTETAHEGRCQTSSASESRQGPVWAFGGRLASRHVAIGRKTYRSCAEAAEWALNTLEVTNARARDDRRAIAVGIRDMVAHLSDRSFSAARDMRARLKDLDQRGFDALEANLKRTRADCRAMALRGQIATDTNVKAYFDCVEDLAQVTSLRDAAAIQVSFFWDQCHRSIKQIADLQRMAVDTWRKAAFPGAA